MITSVGYSGTIDEVNEDAWGRISVFGAEYSAGGPLDCKVSIVSGVDRTVRVATGSLWGKGILDTSDSTVDIQLAPIASGQRWDTIVARRDRSAGPATTTFMALTGTASKVVAASRAVGWVDGKDDQPIALARVAAGQSNVVEVVDIRCWAGGALFGGALESLDYIKAPGASVVLPDGSSYVRTVAANGNPLWQRTGLVDADGPAFYGNYDRQATKRVVIRKDFRTDANGDVIVLRAGAFIGILAPYLVGADIYPLTFAFRMSQGNLVARVWQGTTLRTNTTFAAVADVLYW